VEGDEIFREIGRLDEFERQTRVAEAYGLDIVGPVYKSWKPSHRVVDQVRENSSLRNFSTLDLFFRAKSIIEMYLLMTVRQVYYVLVSEQTINNNLSEYRRVVNILKRARLAGLIRFDSIVDDTREAEKTHSWSSVEDILYAALRQYRSDWWRDQPRYVEVWLEKRALRRIFYPITNSYDVYLCTGGGYQSWSEVWQGRNRFEARKGKVLRILYFGDLDPSGKDMPRDIRERFSTLGIDVDVVEVALTREDIDQYDLPRNPTKRDDARKKWYIERYGIDYAVELDALPPDVLREKIRLAVRDNCDVNLLEKHKAEDERLKKTWRKRIQNLSEKLI